jgi:hypothetical protein
VVDADEHGHILGADPGSVFSRYTRSLYLFPRVIASVPQWVKGKVAISGWVREGTLPRKKTVRKRKRGV